MKKPALIGLILGGALALGGASVYAANQIAKSNAIGEDAAQNFAFVDAGVSPEDANLLKTEFDFEHGKFVYEIDFTADGVKYEYTIDSATGDILERETEKLPMQQTPAAQQTPVATAKPTVTPPSAEESKPATGAAEEKQAIALDAAKQAAFSAAGLSAADVTVSKTKLDRENGRLVYEVEFFIAGERKYEYDVDAYTGEIVGESVELWEMDDYEEYHIPRPEPGAEETPAQNGAEAGTQSAGVQGATAEQSAAATEKPATAEKPAAESKPAAAETPAEEATPATTEKPAATEQPAATEKPAEEATPATTEKPAQTEQPAPPEKPAEENKPAPTEVPAQSATPTQPSAPAVTDIGVEQAKAIALSHAGVSQGSAVFKKAKQDHEDGILVYEIEFDVVGQAEYEYEIDATTGAILEAELDEWDDD